jgi:hypothetical protein
MSDTKKQQLYNEGHSAALQGMARNTLYKELNKLYWNMGYDDGLLKLYNITRGGK